MRETKEIKLSITVRVPRVPKFGLQSESDSEVQNRILKLHQSFSDRRRQIETQYKKKKDISKYHAELFKLAQDQFARTMFANWRKFYLIVDGKRKTPILTAPI